MKTQQFQLQLKKLVKSNSFKEDPIISCSTIPLGQQNTQDMKVLNDNSFFYLPKPLTQADFVHIPTTINHLDKNSFMKTFLRKSVVFAITLLIANLFFAQQNFGQTFVTNPASPFTVPAGVTSITVECWGRGGSGGGATGSGFLNVTNTGGGGGGGGAYKTATLSVTSGQTYTITYGVVGSTGTGNGGAGGATTVTGTGGTVTANGGAGGIANNGAGGAGRTRDFQWRYRRHREY